jgi:hypothetical protein
MYKIEKDVFQKQSAHSDSYLALYIYCVRMEGKYFCIIRADNTKMIRAEITGIEGININIGLIYVAQSVLLLSYGLDDWGSTAGTGWDFFFSSLPRRDPALGSTQPIIQWVPGLKRPGHKAAHPPPHNAEVKNAWSYTSTPRVFMA